MAEATQEQVIFKSNPGRRVHCEYGNPRKPIVFDNEGFYSTSQPEEIEVLKKSKYISIVGDESDEGSTNTDGSGNAEKEPSKKDLVKKAVSLGHDEREAKKLNKDGLKELIATLEAQSGDNGAASTNDETHTLVQADFDANPNLAEKYKVGDVVKVSDLQ